MNVYRIRSHYSNSSKEVAFVQGKKNAVNYLLSCCNNNITGITVKNVRGSEDIIHDEKYIAKMLRKHFTDVILYHGKDNARGSVFYSVEKIKIEK